MKFTKFIPAFLLLMLLSFAMHAQNGRAVISEVRAEYDGNGTATLIVRVSGNLANPPMSGTFTVRPSGTTGITASRPLLSTIESPTGPSNNSVILIGTFPYSAPLGPGPESYDVEIRVTGLEPHYNTLMGRPYDFY